VTNASIEVLTREEIEKIVEEDLKKLLFFRSGCIIASVVSIA
jgi:hypothetical protein